MVRRERRIGDYFRLPACQFASIGESGGARATMVLLMEELHATKKYRELTLFLAVNIADNYLAVLSNKGKAAPRVIPLGMVSLLLAAKINEPMLPNF